MPDNQEDTIFKKVIDFIKETHLARNNIEIIDRTGFKKSRFYGLLKNYEGRNNYRMSEEDIGKLIEVFGSEVEDYYQALIQRKSKSKILDNFDNDIETALKANKFLVNYIDIGNQIAELEKEVSERLKTASLENKEKAKDLLNELARINKRLKEIRDNFKI